MSTHSIHKYRVQREKGMQVHLVENHISYFEADNEAFICKRNARAS